jgi:glycosyltransferase involved in cell wall biosynthesis
MQNDQPLLTIAVPTYNRSFFLNELLSCLFEQCRSNPRVELLVSDNASTDETPGIVTAYMDRGLQIQYLRNISNIGADANFMQCFERARGKYVWLIGDDDVVVPGAIGKIVSYLEASEYSLIYVNSYSFEGVTATKRVKFSRPPQVIKDAHIFVRAIHINLTFVSGNIINKDLVMASNQKKFSSLVGTNLVQLGWIYAALNGYIGGLYIHEKLVGMRTNNTGGYLLSQVFGLNLKDVTERCLDDRRLAQSIINGTLMRFLPAALLNLRRSSERFEREQAPDSILRPVFGDNVRYWFFLLPVIKMPYVLASIWFFLIRILNKLDKSSGSLLMR